MTSKPTLTDELAEALRERIAFFWCNTDESFNNSFRLDYPNHSIIKAENLLARYDASVKSDPLGDALNSGDGVYRP